MRHDTQFAKMLINSRIETLRGGRPLPTGRKLPRAN